MQPLTCGLQTYQGKPHTSAPILCCVFKLDETQAYNISPLPSALSLLLCIRKMPLPVSCDLYNMSGVQLPLVDRAFTVLVILV